MKKEWLAVALLAAVVLGSVLNLRFLKSFTAELDGNVADAVTEADAENWASAETLALRALQDWTDMDKYTHIFIRHGAIDEVTSGFCTLMGTIYAKDLPALYAAQLALHDRLTELYEMERVTPGSIL